MSNNLTKIVEKVSEIETLGILIESMTDFVGPIFVEEDIETISGKKGESGEYIAVTVSLMIPLHKKPSVVKDFRVFKKDHNSKDRR